VPAAPIVWERLRRLTVVPFLHDGRCALIPAGERLVLPSGEVLPGEDPMPDTGLRVPLITAGFRRQGLHPFAAEGDHVYVWSEGDDGYRGRRPHAEVDLGSATPNLPAGPTRRRRGSGATWNPPPDGRRRGRPLPREDQAPGRPPSAGGRRGWAARAIRGGAPSP
jgi:hypothetical protein